MGADIPTSSGGPSTAGGEATTGASSIGRSAGLRARGEKDGLTRVEAERDLRRLVEADAAQAARPAVERAKCVDEAANALRERLELEGIRSSYRRNLESMQRVHVSPALADRRVDSVRREDIERLARAMAQRRRAA